MTAYSAETLDLSRLGAPSLVEADYAKVLQERLAHLDAAWKAEQAKDPTLPDIDPLELQSAVSVILTGEYAFGDVLLKQAINDAANALRLATASGADLRHLAQTYSNTLALVIDPGDPTANPPRLPVIEADEELRARAQIAPEAFPEFGMLPGGYVWRVKRVFGDRIKGVRAIRRPGGYIDLIVLGRAGDGTPEPVLIGDIQAGFDGEGDFQSTDTVTVLPARIVPYAIEGVLQIRRGPDPETVKAAAVKRLQRLILERHAIAENVPRNQIEAASLGSPAIAEEVILVSPLADVIGGADGAPFCTGIDLRTEVLR